MCTKCTITSQCLYKLEKFGISCSKCLFKIFFRLHVKLEQEANPSPYIQSLDERIVLDDPKRQPGG